LLDIELRVINTLDIGTKAKDLYKLKYDYPDDKISKRCIDFKNMEQLAMKYREKQ